MTTGMTRSFHDKTLQWAPAGERVSNVCVLEGCTRRVGSRSKNKYFQSRICSTTLVLVLPPSFRAVLCFQTIPTFYHVRAVEKTASRPSVGREGRRVLPFLNDAQMPPCPPSLVTDFLRAKIFLFFSFSVEPRLASKKKKKVFLPCINDRE